jgi:hypothetical protein
MANFDPRSLDDDDFRIGPHPTPRQKSNWPPSRVLGWVIAIGGLSVVLNAVSVVVVYCLIVRIDNRIAELDKRLAAAEPQNRPVAQLAAR